MWWIIGIAAGLFLLGQKKHARPQGENPIPIRVEIGQWDEQKGYPFKYILEDGTTDLVYFNEEEAKAAIEKAQQLGLEIVENAFDTSGETPADREEDYPHIVTFRYRIYKDGMSKVYKDGTIYIKMDYSNGTHREVKTDEEGLEIYLRNAKRDGATITTF